MARGEFDLAEGKPDISAAGGVVLRRDEEGRTRVAVIHRPKYGDWSLPKGKLEKGEGWQEAALREVHEEIGYGRSSGRSSRMSPTSIGSPAGSWSAIG